MRWILVCVAVVLIAGCGDDDDTGRAPARLTPVTYAQPDARYVVDGDEAGAVTYTNASGDTSQTEVDFRDGHWTLNLGPWVGDFLYVSVQNQRSYGTVECTILVDGDAVASAESDVDYGIATCSYP